MVQDAHVGAIINLIVLPLPGTLAVGSTLLSLVWSEVIALTCDLN